MKVAILVPTFNFHSGFDRVAQLQAEDYVKKGHQVTVVTLEGKMRSSQYDVVELGSPKGRLGGLLSRLFFFCSPQIKKYELLKDCDIAISHFYPMNLLAQKAKKKYGLKYIYWDHGVNTTGLLDNFIHKVYMALFLFFSNRSLKGVDEAYSVSDYLRKELWKESKLKSKVVYNEIDTKRFNKNVKGDSIIKKHNLSGNKVFLYVGRLSPHKGIHLLIEAFKKVQEELPDSKLIIAGKPSFKSYLKDLKKIANENVIFTGFVKDEDLPKYYAACDVYCSCSQWEGYNLPAGEAQACGKPVIAFNLGSHPEVVKKGILIKNKDIDAFANAMKKLSR